MVRGALPRLDRTWLISQPGTERVHETALSDAGLAGDVDDAALTLPGALPGASQPGQLIVAADDRRKRPPRRHLEATDRARRTQDAVDGDRTRDALQRFLPQRLGLEVALDEVVRLAADHDRSVRCDRLDPGRDVGHLTHDLVLRRHGAGTHLSGHDHA